MMILVGDDCDLYSLLYIQFKTLVCKQHNFLFEMIGDWYCQFKAAALCFLVVYCENISLKKNAGARRVFKSNFLRFHYVFQETQFADLQILCIIADFAHTTAASYGSLLQTVVWNLSTSAHSGSTNVLKR